MSYKRSSYKLRGREHCRFAAAFMARGGIYGRSMRYPWRAGMVCRIFRTAIRIHFREPDFRPRSANSVAFNRQFMHVQFAYQWRRQSWSPPPPKARKTLPRLPPVMAEQAPLWQDAA